MYSIVVTTRFKKDFKRSKGYILFPFDAFKEVLNFLKKGQKLAAKYKDHALTGDLQTYRECHLLYDLILIYKIDPTDKTVYLARVGSHSQLF